MGKLASSTLQFRLRVKPRARRLGLTRASDGSLVARVPAPPVEGRANAAVVALVARSLRVPKGAVRITSGAGARTKRISVASADVAGLRRRLATLPNEATAAAESPPSG